jgi:hypothetical protein
MGQPGAMVAASMGRAKIAGLVIDKKEVGAAGEFDHMSNDELRAYIAAEAQALNIIGSEGRKHPVD